MDGFESLENEIPHLGRIDHPKRDAMQLPEMPLGSAFGCVDAKSLQVVVRTTNETKIQLYSKKKPVLVASKKIKILSAYWSGYWKATSYTQLVAGYPSLNM